MGIDDEVDDEEKPLEPLSAARWALCRVFSFICSASSCRSSISLNESKNKRRELTTKNDECDRDKNKNTTEQEEKHWF